MRQPTRFQQRMLEAVRSLEPGEVISFADVAARAGRPRAARAAGNLLSTVADTIPWWRVVYADGRLPPCHPQRQTDRLIAEGVRVEDGRVVESPRGRFEQ